MSAPLLVEVRRGAMRESVHFVHAVVVDTEGGIVREWGSPHLVMHPRSAVKPLQALPLVETGAADAFGLGDTELALACASHNGEPGHVDVVENWLERIGCTPADLECGVQASRGDTPMGNYCSGKHVGFLTIARHLGAPTKGYIEAGHPVQRLVTEALTHACPSTRTDAGAVGIDGCGIPVHPMPLASLALSAARFGTPDAWPPDRRSAVRRLAAAMVREPWFVAGTDRVCTDLLRDADGSLLVKVGAEGVQWASLPEQGLGIAVKASDGATRASEIALMHVLQVVEGHDRPAVWDRRRIIRNHAGTVVGSLAVG